MNSFRISRRALVAEALALAFASTLSFSIARAADAKPADAPKGQRVYSAGHSFHVFMPGILAGIAKSAGIADHLQVGVSSIGGSYIHQHWAKEGDKEAKALIPREKPDVFTMSPIYLPDDGIENFVRLVSEESPKTRVLLQEFWLPYDVYDVNYKKQKPATPDRDAMTAEYLRTEYGKYFRVMDAYVEELNKKFGKTIVYVTPVGQAVVALREKVIAGEAPGITKQSELFTDPIGHCTGPIKVLTAYCHYAVIYGKSPVGLPVPGTLESNDTDEETTEKLNELLQEIAWQAVTAHPLSGVKKPLSGSSRPDAPGREDPVK
jgi:hypothetical protein